MIRPVSMTTCSRPRSDLLPVPTSKKNISVSYPDFRNSRIAILFPPD